MCNAGYIAQLRALRSATGTKWRARQRSRNSLGADIQAAAMADEKPKVRTGLC